MTIELLINKNYNQKIKKIIIDINYQYKLILYRQVTIFLLKFKSTIILIYIKFKKGNFTKQIKKKLSKKDKLKKKTTVKI